MSVLSFFYLVGRLFKTKDVFKINTMYAEIQTLLQTKNLRSFCSEEAPHNNLANSLFVSTVRMNKNAINNFVKLTTL